METEVIRAAGTGLDLEGLERAARCLAEGGIVAFPTETVYGLGAYAGNPQAVDRLYSLKGRPREKPFTIHVSEFKEVEQYVEKLPPLALKFTRRFWPGPLTLVVPGKGESGARVGLRMPSNFIALELIRRANVPIYVPSANRHGELPALSYQEVLEVFDGRIEMVVDGGQAGLGESSTVVEVEEFSWRVLRHGAVPEETLRRIATTNILFICTGNTCRSPMAEALARRLLAEAYRVDEADLQSVGIRIRSAGTAASEGRSASPGALQAMLDRGLSLENHSSWAVTFDHCLEADWVFVMSQDHQDTLRQWVPDCSARIQLLDPDGRNIPDPFGGTDEEYRACADQIETSIKKSFEQYGLLSTEREKRKV